MTSDEHLWPIVAVLGTLMSGYVIYAFKTGSVRDGRRWTFSLRANNPVGYWSSIVLWAFMAAVCWCLVAKALVDMAAQP